jgi:hypothetical protein
MATTPHAPFRNGDDTEGIYNLAAWVAAGVLCVLILASAFAFREQKQVATVEGPVMEKSLVPPITQPTEPEPSTTGQAVR